ncbi:MAG: PH domain-containing protein [Ruminococcus sp.]|nr:PH domain-containing protein [Ruminococcus sp.]
MIDFQNKLIFKLKQTDNSKYASIIAPLLIEGESIISTYSSMRDGVVFTNKRIMPINIQGITGTKKDISSLPYNKIQAFSVETAGTFDLDSELEVYFSSIGKVKFEFSGNCNITEIGSIISNFLLK